MTNATSLDTEEQEEPAGVADHISHLPAHSLLPLVMPLLSRDILPGSTEDFYELQAYQQENTGPVSQSDQCSSLSLNAGVKQGCLPTAGLAA